ncbi:MAG TPA: hypothetical protein VM783_14720, partial [Candidatus Acidoferrum sp.]|nr:hypothetical protein [Candidatus Acidoferrum sp.]
AESDHAMLKLDIENRAAGVLQQLDSLPPRQTSARQTIEPSDPRKKEARTKQTKDLTAGGSLRRAGSSYSSSV